MKKALIATAGFSFLYALQLVFQQIFVRGRIDPLHLNFLTYFISAIILASYFLLFKRKEFVILPKKKISLMFFVALTGWILADLFTVYGLKLSSSTNYSLLSRLGIFVVFILSIIFLKEKSFFTKIIALLIAFIGGLLVVYKFNSSLTINIGDLFFLLSMIVQSISTISKQKVTEHMDSLQLTFLLFTYAAIILGLITFIFFPIKSIGYYQFIIFNSILNLTGYCLVNYAIQEGGAVVFTLASNLLPVFTIIFSFLILKQLPIYTQLIGGILIIFSIFIFLKKNESR